MRMATTREKERMQSRYAHNTKKHATLNVFFENTQRVDSDG